MGEWTSSLEGLGRLMFNLDFYRGERVFLTGHTGFKGAWMSRVLVNAGAIVTGYSLTAPTEPNLFSLAGLEGYMTSVIGDIRDYDALKAVGKLLLNLLLHVSRKILFQPVNSLRYR